MPTLITEEVLRQACLNLVHMNALSVEDLTQAQLAEVISKMIKSGDFRRFISLDSQSQVVVYIPFAEREAILAKYNELLFAVAQKYPNETRHETALRYIKEREDKINTEAIATYDNPTNL